MFDNAAVLFAMPLVAIAFSAALFLKALDTRRHQPEESRRRGPLLLSGILLTFSVALSVYVIVTLISVNEGTS